jgi:hypothetical protein
MSFPLGSQAVKVTCCIAASLLCLPPVPSHSARYPPGVMVLESNVSLFTALGNCIKHRADSQVVPMSAAWRVHGRAADCSPVVCLACQFFCCHPSLQLLFCSKAATTGMLLMLLLSLMPVLPLLMRQESLFTPDPLSTVSCRHGPFLLLLTDLDALCL